MEPLLQQHPVSFLGKFRTQNSHYLDLTSDKFWGKLDPVVVGIDSVVFNFLLSGLRLDGTILVQNVQLWDGADIELVLDLLSVNLVIFALERHGGPWHLLEIVLELFFFLVPGNPDDLQFLAIGVDSVVELSQLSGEHLAGWAPMGREIQGDDWDVVKAGGFD